MGIVISDRQLWRPPGVGVGKVPGTRQDRTERNGMEVGSVGGSSIVSHPPEQAGPASAVAQRSRGCAQPHGRLLRAGQRACTQPQPCPSCGAPTRCHRLLQGSAVVASSRGHSWDLLCAAGWGHARWSRTDLQTAFCQAVMCLCVIACPQGISLP